MASKTRLIFEGDNRTRRAFSEINGSMGKLKGSLTGLVGSARGFAAILGAGVLGRAAKQSLDFADKVQKLNVRLGASTEFLSEMRFASEQAGVSFDQFALALQRSQRRIGEAAAGAGEAQGALRELGLSAQKLAQLTPDEQFTVLASALADVESETERLRLAFKLFDSEGVAVLQLLEDGAEGMERMRQDARDLGVSLSKDAAQGAAAANDAINRLTTAFRGAVQELALNFAPGLEAVANFLANSVPRALKIAQGAFSGFAAAVGLAIGTAAGVLASFAEKVSAALRLFGAPGADTLQGAGERLREFQETLTRFSYTSANTGQELFKLGLGFRVVAREAEAARTSTEQLVNSVRGADLEPGKVPKIKPRVEILEETEQPLDQLKERIATAIAGGADQGAKGMLESFRAVLGQLAQELLRSSLISLLTGGRGGGGGLFGSLFGGTKAAGGAVGPGIYRVGEFGPETVAIGGSGVIYPNQGGGGGRPVQLVYNVDARGADPTAEVRIRRALQQTQQQTIARMRDLEKRRR